MRNEPETRLAQRIKELRLEKNLTQKQLAAELGVSYASVVDYENGRREPNFKAMAALERFFNVSADYLLGNVDRATFLSKSDDVQGELDNLIDIFMDFKSHFERGAQDDQLLAVAALREVVTLLSVYVLRHWQPCHDLTLDELMSPMRAVFDLNAEGRAELVKRAIELTELERYQI